MTEDQMLDIKRLANDPLYREATMDMAKMLRQKYEALVVVGFTPSEALYIATYQGISFAPTDQGEEE